MGFSPRITFPAPIPQVQSDTTETNPAAADYIKHKQVFGTAAFASLGTGTGAVPLIPIPMSQLSDGVKGTMDTIRSHADSAAYRSETFFATAEQGALASSALQSFTETDPVASAALTTHAALSTTAHRGIVASSDSRLTDQRTPSDASVTDAKVASGAAIALSKLAVNPLARANHTGTQTLSTISDAGTIASHAVADFTTPAQVDARIASLINAAPSALDTLGEIATQLAADETAAASLTTALSTEVTNRTAAVTAEAASRVAGDATNATAVTTETSARIAADAVLATSVTTEATARGSGDSTNATAIASEASARASADTTLASSITAITPHKTTATLDFGFASANEGDLATTTVMAAWVSSTSRIVCVPSPSASADHSTDETIAEDIHFSAVNIVNGTSFDVQAYAPQGTWGRHNCAIIGF